MRTNIEINEDLMKEALQASGESTKKGAVEAALKLLVRIKAQDGIRSLRGKVVWEGNLDESRLGRFTAGE